MALNMCEMWFNGIKIAFFSKKFQKIAQQLGASPPDPRLWYVWVTLAFSKPLQSYVFALFNYISLSPLPSPKSWLSANREIFDDVIACDLWFRPPQSKILATPINWRLPEKVFWRSFFFFGERLRLCPWSLASRGSVLGKAVLGLGFFLFPWPWPPALCPRLHLW